MLLARPAPRRRAAARPRHRVVPDRGRADRRGARLPPLRRQEPAGRPARLRPRGPRPHDARALGRGARARRRRPGRDGSGAGVSEAAERDAPADPALHRGARGAARVDALVRRARDPPARAGVGGGRGVPARAVHPHGRARLPGAQVPGGVRRPGRRLRPRRGLRARRWRAAAPAAWRPGIGAHVGIATPPIFKFGTEEQKQRWLVPAIKGEKIARAGDHRAGRAARTSRASRTFARRDDDEYVVNGSKTFITNGVRADIYVTAVKTTEEGGHQGLSFLVIEQGHARLRRSRASSRSSAGTPPTPASCPSGRARAGREPARRGEPGLLPDHGQLPVGAPADGARRRRRACRRRSSARSPTRRSARRSAARSAASRRSATSWPRWRR